MPTYMGPIQPPKAKVPKFGAEDKAFRLKKEKHSAAFLDRLAQKVKGGEGAYGSDSLKNMGLQIGNNPAGKFVNSFTKEKKKKTSKKKVKTSKKDKEEPFWAQLKKRKRKVKCGSGYVKVKAHCRKVVTRKKN